MIKIQVDIDDRAVTQMLQRMIDAGQNPSTALKEVGLDLVESTKQRFQTTQTAPDGSRWAENSPVTLARKAGNKPLTGETGSLMKEIHYQLISNDTLEVGSIMDYAATQQFGAKQGQFGRNKRNAPIPWGDIPARPFLGISTEDEQTILDTFNNYLRDQAER